MPITPRTADDRLRLTDAGIETVLIFEHGVDLPAFAAFPLLDTGEGRRLLADYMRPFLQLAGEHDAGFVLETPTWRANADWGATLGYGTADLARISEDAVRRARELADQVGAPDVLVSGCVGPRGDGYVIDRAMSVDEAADYHTVQIEDLASAGADLVTSFTLAQSAEAAGFVTAAAGAGIPAVVGLTVETDGRLPSGETLPEAVSAIDSATSAYASWFMINCAHPDHVEQALVHEGAWRHRIGAVRANASRQSHAELDEAETLDDGDPWELAQGYGELRDALPALGVVGGCCGTDLRHVRAIAETLL